MKKLLLGAAVAAALLVPASAASAGPIVGVRDCPTGYFGVVVYHADYNTGDVELVSVCVPLRP